MLFFGPVVAMCRIKNEIRETQISFKKRRSPHRDEENLWKYLDVLTYVTLTIRNAGGNGGD